MCVVGDMSTGRQTEHKVSDGGCDRSMVLMYVVGYMSTGRLMWQGLSIGVCSGRHVNRQANRTLSV